MEQKIYLYRPAKDVADNVLVFKADEKLAKPEIKQYLEKLYNISIEKINTARFMSTVTTD